VVLVGGGPGDPGLITVRGMEVLRAADVVVVNRLAPVGLLADLADDVEVVDVSKVPRGRFTPQEQINDLLVEHARRGSTVVRLKGGDPFVFGRGMEEAQARAAAGVPVQVVPGVTWAVSVPALAGSPVTRQGLSLGSAW
jgi:siroheme synthase